MPPAELMALARPLAAHFDVNTRGDVLVLTRNYSFLPPRGGLRFLTPRLVSRITLNEGRPVVSIRPDGWAWIFLFMCAGATVVEFAMDRVTYPREYPPAAVLFLSAYALIGLAAQWVDVRSKIRAVTA
jgi:hypothetical protein